MSTEIIQAAAIPDLITGIDLEQRALILGEGNQIKVHEVAEFEAVMAAYRREGDIRARMDFLRRHRKVISPLLVDQAGGILVDYAGWEAIQRLGGDDRELGLELLRDLLPGVRILSVADNDEAATLIRAVHLSLGVGDEDYGRVIVDQIRQQVRWIETHRAEIDARNPQYKGQPIRPSASWISQLVGVDNKRVERVYQNVEFGLEELAALPSLGSDRIVQPGVGRPRGRVARVAAGRPGGGQGADARGRVGEGGTPGASLSHIRLPNGSSGGPSANQPAHGNRLICASYPNWWIEDEGEGFAAVASLGRRERFETLAEARTFVAHLHKKWWRWHECDSWINKDGNRRWLIVRAAGQEASLYLAVAGDLRRLEWRVDGDYRELQRKAQLWEEDAAPEDDGPDSWFTAPALGTEGGIAAGTAPRAST
jgi:hypothetical protein